MGDTQNSHNLTTRLVQALHLFGNSYFTRAPDKRVTEDNSKIFFLISQRKKYVVTQHIFQRIIMENYP